MSIIETLRARIADRSEPLWRETTYWLIVLTFFSLPLVAMIIHLAVIFEHVDFKLHSGEFSYVWTFHKILAGLLGTMLGLNSWDKRNGQAKPNGPPQQ